MLFYIKIEWSFHGLVKGSKRELIWFFWNSNPWFYIQNQWWRGLQEYCLQIKSSFTQIKENISCGIHQVSSHKSEKKKYTLNLGPKCHLRIEVDGWMELDGWDGMDGCDWMEWIVECRAVLYWLEYLNQQPFFFRCRKFDLLSRWCTEIELRPIRGRS